MIVVKDDNSNPFEVHAFVCDTRQIARKLTYALAAAFQEYSEKIKHSKNVDNLMVNQKFAIDLRSPSELQEGMQDETEA